VITKKEIALPTKRERLLELIEEATIDCYNEDEEHSGLLTMIQDNVVCPFRAKVIGEEVTVVDLEWPKSGYGLLAVCERKGKKHRVDINSLEWIKPRPEGFEWIEAYLLWRGGVDKDFDEEDDD
jgi:Calcium binding